MFKVLDISKSVSCCNKTPQELQLNDNHVDIWLVLLDIEETIIDKLEIILSEDEKMRAERFFSVEQRRQFIAARAFLRLILSSYLKAKPEELQFQYNAYRKPSLSGEFNETGLNFNASHSHETALYGVTLKRAIGVDVEKIRPNLSFEKIAARQFTESELMLFHKSPESKKIQTFFTLWTRKEAILKGTAEGFHFPMKQFDVSDSPYKSVKFLNNSTNPGNKSEWFIHDIEIRPGFCAAFATEGQHDVIKLYKASFE